MNKQRAVAGLTLLTGIPTLGGLDTLGQIAVPSIILTALVVVAVWVFRGARHEIRHGRHGEETIAVEIGE